MVLRYKKVQRGWIVYRQNGTREQHTHFHNLTAAKNFIQLIKKGLKPKSPYYETSAKRVLTVKEYNQLKVEVKQKYYNVGSKQKIRNYKYSY